MSNSRFLIFPWVRRLPGDWQERHGLEPVLAETFVDPAKYRGTCYRAANWQRIGRTKGRKASASEAGRTPKDVYLYPLTKDWKQVLLTGSRQIRTPFPQAAGSSLGSGGYVGPALERHRRDARGCRPPA